MKEFWNSLLTEKSWKLLQNLKKKYDFIVIGGWAVYLLTRQLKSKDIDILVDIGELQKLKQEDLIKNNRLKKYELKFEEVDVDIYVSYFSKFVIPVEEIKNYILKIEGFKIICPEALLILKQAAELDRRNSMKGEKDKIDIISLMFFSEIDFKKYKTILERYSVKNYLENLKNLVLNFKDYNALELNPREFKLKKSAILKKIK